MNSWLWDEDKRIALDMNTVRAFEIKDLGVFYVVYAYMIGSESAFKLGEYKTEAEAIDAVHDLICELEKRREGVKQ